MSQPILQLSHVTKIIGQQKILDDVSFEVYPGEVFGFVGPNGAGKTMTIRLIVGLMAATSGQILVAGHDISRDFKNAIANVGAIVENPEFYPYLSGWKNLLHFSRMIPGVTKERIEETVRLVHMESRIKEKVKTYSLGMRQRLGIANAMLRKPKLLILDEPTNGLDPAGIREMRDYIRKLAHEEGSAVFVSSHMLAEMELMCDRVAIIQQGTIRGVKSVHELMLTRDKALVHFELHPDERELALEVVRKYLLNRASHGDVVDSGPVLQESGLEMQADREQTAEINRLLNEANVRVYSIRQTKASLEDHFLQVTGGEQVV